jgi:hypothetical protein
MLLVWKELYFIHLTVQIGFFFIISFKPSKKWSFSCVFFLTNTKINSSSKYKLSKFDAKKRKKKLMVI